MAERSPYEKKPLWEKEKLLVTFPTVFAKDVYVQTKVCLEKSQATFCQSNDCFTYYMYYMPLAALTHNHLQNY